MDKYGITKDGFRRKDYNNILSSMESKSRELFGESVNLSERSPLGMFIQNIAWELKDIWQVAEDTYNSGYVDTAEGISQDSVGKYIAITRNVAQQATGIITVTGDKDTLIPTGFKISTEATELTFEILESKVIEGSGTVDIPIIAVLPGLEGNVPANTITRIVNPISGVKTVTNIDTTRDGTNTETDADFRERYYRSISRGGSSTRESVEAALLDMDNVTDAFVEENETMEFAGDIPPKALAPYVFGGVDEDIAQVILSSKAGGIRSYGTTEILAKDSKGIEHTIGFTRPTVKDIYIKLIVTKGSGYIGDLEVKRAVLSYVGGQGEEGITYKGVSLGEPVIISRIIGRTSLQGVEDISVELSLDGVTYSTSNIAIDTKEIARTDIDKVVILYVE